MKIRRDKGVRELFKEFQHLYAVSENRENKGQEIIFFNNNNNVSQFPRSEGHKSLNGKYPLNVQQNEGKIPK